MSLVSVRRVLSNIPAQMPHNDGLVYESKVLTQALFEVVEDVPREPDTTMSGASGVVTMEVTNEGALASAKINLAEAQSCYLPHPLCPNHPSIHPSVSRAIDTCILV